MRSKRMTGLLAAGLTGAAAAAAIWAGAALADERYGIVADPMTKKECGDCHMAFQPSFLPARSWEKIMNTLSDHFGEDASLPPEKVAAIRKYLMANAADRRWRSKMMRGVRKDWTPLRITELPYWKREHEEEVPARAWKDPRVGSKANCKACHRYADTGIYEAEEYEYGDGWLKYRRGEYEKGKREKGGRYREYRDGKYRKYREHEERERHFGRRGYYEDDDD